MKLTLRAEALAELTSDELGEIVAARPESIATCPVFECLNRPLTGTGCPNPGSIVC